MGDRFKPESVIGMGQNMHHDRNRPKGRNTKLLFVEIDMDTEPNVRRKSVGTSIKKKLEKYARAYQAAMHTHTYGVRNMRVLFITTSRKKIQNIIDMLRSMGINDGIFLFATHENVNKGSSILELKWDDNLNLEVSLASSTLQI